MKHKTFLPILFKVLNISMILLMVVTQLGWGSVSVAQAAPALPPPSFSVFIVQNQVHGYNWAEGVSVEMTIDDPGIPGSPDYTDTQESEVAPWDSSATWVPFDLNGTSFTLQAGQVVTLVGDGVTRIHTVTNLVVTAVSADDNTVAGTADPGSIINVGDVCDGGGCARRTVTADGSGNWLANFSVAGAPPDDTTFDIVPGTESNASQGDADGDGTVYFWRMPRPYIQASPQNNWVNAYDWPDETTLTLTIDEDNNGSDDFNTTAVTARVPWNPTEIRAEFNLNGFDLEPGDEVTVSDGPTTRSMIPTNLAVTGFDAALDKITGVGDKTLEVHTCANVPGNCYSRYVMPDGAGDWQADYLHEGPRDDEKDLVNLQPNSDGWASQTDGGGNQTWYDWRVPSPYIKASAQDNWVQAFDWPDGSTVSLTIEDPTTPASPDLDDVQATVGPAPWNPNEYMAQFDLGGFDVQPGQEIEVSGSGTTREMTVTDLAVNAFDTDLETIDGVGETGLEVVVCANMPGYCVPRYIVPVAGAWDVDFNTPGPTPDESETVDLQPGSDGWAAQRDDDGDETWYNWRVPRPYIQANPGNNWVQAYDWPNGVTVTLTIDADDDGSIDHTSTAVMGPADWDPNTMRAWFDLGGFDLEPGDRVTITDGPTTRSMLPTNLEVTGHDLAADTLTGVGDPALEVQTCVDVPGNCYSRYVMPDGAGGWTTNYAVEGPRDDEKNTIDLIPGSRGWAAQRDGEGNETWHDWNIPNPWIQVNPYYDNIEAREWPDGANLTAEIDDPATPANPDQTATARVEPAPWNPDDILAIFNLSGYDIKPGFEVTVTDGTTSRTMTVSNLAITNFDLPANRITGVGRPGEEVEVCVNQPPDNWNCYSRYTTPDGAGDWMVDYSIVGPRDNEKDLFDLIPGSDGWMVQTDADGNRTWVDWNILDPWIEASTTNNWVHAREWPVDTIVHLTIDGPDPDTDPDMEADGIIGPSAWDPYDIAADFDLSGFDIQPGQTLVVTDGVTSKTLVASGLGVTGYDLEADTLTGAASPSTDVRVCANTPSACFMRYVASDGAGAWTADYGHEGPRNDEKTLVDLRPGSDGWANEYDSDGDRTQIDWRIFDPYIEANPGSQWVHALEWTLGAEVTLTIEDDSTALSPDLTVNATVVEAPWNSTETWVDFDLSGFILRPGQTLTVAGGGSTRTMVTTNLSVTAYDLAAETVSGVGDPNLEVQVCVNAPFNMCYSRYAAPAADGSWTVDYANWGPRDDEHQLFDVVPSSSGWARQTDAEGNQTFHDWQVPNPYISSIADQVTNEDTPLNAIPFVVDSRDVSPDDLTVTADSSDPTLVPVGNITFGGSGTDRTISMTPAANQSGETTITVTVDDGAVQNSITFLVTVNPVNDAPGLALADKVLTMREDVSTASPVKVATITIQDDGLGTNTLSLTGADASMFEISGSDLRLKAGAVLDYETNATLNVTVQVNDSTVGATPDDSESMIINISNANDAPVITEGASVSVTMSENGKFKAFSLTLHATDQDPSSTLTWKISTAAGHGTAVATGTGGSKAITYTPVKDYFGTDSFVVEVSDGSGGIDRITVNVTITKVENVFMPMLLK